MFATTTVSSNPGLPTADPRRWFSAWLLAFYAAWLTVVGAFDLGAIVRDHSAIAWAMAGGSFVAGSSPVAGGSVGFPVLVYLFDHPARLGRDFSLLIQSIGMVSASIFIITHGRRVEWRLLRFALLGACVGMPLGMLAVAPHVSEAGVKILFSVVYASFGLLHLARLREIVANEGPSRTRFTADPAIGMTVGLVGGLLASVIGVGADMLLYGILVLLYHTDVKIAIPSAVILMACTSLIGACGVLFGAAAFPGGEPQIREVFHYWLAAAPVVILGAPLGSVVSRIVPRQVILAGVAVLCLSQLGWTCYHEQVTGWWLVLAIAGVIFVNLAMHLLFLFGRRSLPPDHPPAIR